MGLRVLMIGWELPPYNSGGLGVACCGLANALSQKDIKITFVLPRQLDISAKGFDLVFADSAANMKFKDVLLEAYTSCLTEGGISIKAAYCNRLIDEVLHFARCIGVLAKKLNFDIIHAHDWLSFPAGMVAKKISGKPLVCQIHSTEIDRTGGNNVYQEIYDIEKQGMKAADKVITVSNHTKNTVVERYDISPDKVNVVYNGINHREFDGVADGLDPIQLKKMGYKIVLFVGRITLQKGPDYLIKAARKVLDYYPKTYFIFVGSGDMEGKIIEEAGNLGILDKVIFTGFLRDKERNRLYKSADLFVMPSVSDPFGLVALESLMLNTPVLMSKQSGVSEVVPNSLKVDFWDVDEMANKILAVLTFPSLKNTLALNGHRDVLRLDWGSAADRCIGVYNSLL